MCHHTTVHTVLVESTQDPTLSPVHDKYCTNQAKPQLHKKPCLIKRGKSLLNANVELINLKNTLSPYSTFPQFEERNNASLKAYPVLVPNEGKLFSKPSLKSILPSLHFQLSLI